MSDLNETRRRFMTYFAGIGLGSTLAPGVVWARMQDAGEKKITLAMVKDAMKLSGLEFTDAELKSMVDSANQNLTPLRPMPTAREAAAENARMPEYYVMRRDRGMPATMVARSCAVER